MLQHNKYPVILKTGMKCTQNNPKCSRCNKSWDLFYSRV